MQGHGNNDVGFVDQGSPCAIQPAGKAWYEIEAVAVLKRQDRSSALFVIAHHRASPIERRWIGDTRRAECIATRIKIERQPAALAGWSVEKIDVSPTRRAKAARLGDVRPAPDAKSRIHDIEHVSPDLLPAAFPDSPHTS